MSKRTLQQHINDNRDELESQNLSSQSRLRLERELYHLERYQINHPDTDHDPNAFEIYCDENPDASECRIYED
jgi:hypothetical protein